VGEVRILAENGTREVMLLGQNVNSYGKALEAPADFADLLIAINEIEGIERIRFMTSHPKDISQKLLETMAKADKVCEYLHLPVQAGSNSVLKRMNRRYTREQYMDIVDRARALMPDLGITTDIIMGFPGETDADFADTVDLVKRVGFDSAFTYLYSIRTGTPAAKFEDQVADEVKHERITELLKVLTPIVEARMRSFEGKNVEILVEDFSKKSKEILMGRTRNNLTVTFEGPPELIGKLVDVKITNPRQFSLHGAFVAVKK
jgi:tRNA-2-methylthio-N6-dimethylallyladenosine synthase